MADTSLQALPGETYTQYETRLGSTNTSSPTTGTGFGTPLPYTPPPTINSDNTSPQSPSPYSTPEPTPTPTVPPPDTTQTLTPTEQSIQDLINQTKTDYTNTAGESAYKNTLSGQDLGGGVLTDLQKSQNDLRAQQQQIANEQSQIQLNAPQPGQGGVSSVVANSTYGAKLRDNAIKSLGISSLLAASNGNVAYAQSLVDKAVAAKYDPIKAEIDANLKNLDLIMKSPQYTAEEKARAQAQADIQNKKAQDLADKVQNQKDIWTTATTAASNGQNFRATPQYTTLAQALDAISKAPTKEQALQIATQVGLTSTPKAVTPPGTSVVEVGGRKVLINDLTGATIKDLGAATVSSGSTFGTPTPTEQAVVFSWIGGHPKEASTIDQTKLKSDPTYFWWVYNQVNK